MGEDVIRTRSVTYPANVVQSVADRLCELDCNLPGDEAEQIALDIVIDVTLAVERLRASEAAASTALSDQEAQHG